MELDILERISENYPEYSKLQRNIAEYISANCDKAAFMTVEMLSEAAGASVSSVVRFARGLGYDGFSAMRRALQAALRSRLTSVKDLSEGRLGAESLRETILVENRSLQSVMCRQNELGFEPAVKLIAEANRIFIYGAGDMAGLALHLGYRLKTLGFQVHECCEFSDLESINDSDIYLTLRSSLFLARHAGLVTAKNAGAKTVLICDEELSTAAEYSDVKLYGKGDAGILALINGIISALEQSKGVSLADEMRRREERRREFFANEY